MITSPGIGSGLDIESLVTQLVQLEGQPAQTRLDRREASFQSELSGLGTFRSALDAFRQALEPLKDLSKFGGRTVSSSDEEIFTASGDNTVTPGSYELEVVSLAQSHKLASGAYADAAIPVGYGTLQISVDPASPEGGTFTVDIPEGGDTSLAGVRSAINDAANNPGVVASIINADDGAHLVLTSTLTGAARTIEVTSTGGDGGLDAFVYDSVGGTYNMTEVQAALDSEIRIDSFTHFSATNRVSDAIDGLTLDLVAADPGTTATLSIGLDKDQARSYVENFVSSYNSLLVTAKGLTRYDSETRTAGALQGDSIVPSLLDRVSRAFNKTVTGALNVRDLGISVSLEGTLEVDDEALDEVIDSSFTAVGEIFADKTNGIAVRMDALFDEYLKADGLLDVRTNGLQTSIKGIGSQRERLAIHLIAVEERLRSQFLALDTLVAQLNSTSSFLGAQLANLPNPSALLGKK